MAISRCVRAIVFHAALGWSFLAPSLCGAEAIFDLVLRTGATACGVTDPRTDGSSSATDPACPGGGFAGANASASDTALKAFATTSYVSGAAIYAEAWAGWSTMAVIHGPDALSVTFVPRLILVSSFEVEDPHPPTGSYGAVQITANIAGNLYTGWKTSDGRPPGGNIDLGLGLVRLGNALVTPNEPFLYVVALAASAAGYGDTGEKVITDASNSLTLPPTGPVFELPPGYTVDIPGLHVFDNRVVAAAVPEPGTMLLLGAGLVAVVIPRRRTPIRTRLSRR